MKFIQILLLSNLYLNIPIPKVVIFSSPSPEGIRKTIDLSKLFHSQSTYTTKKLFIWKTKKKEYSILKMKSKQSAIWNQVFSLICALQNIFLFSIQTIVLIKSYSGKCKVYQERKHFHSLAKHLNVLGKTLSKTLTINEI